MYCDIRLCTVTVMETTVPWPANKSYGPWQLIFSTDQLSHSLFLSGYYTATTQLQEKLIRRSTVLLVLSGSFKPDLSRTSVRWYIKSCFCLFHRWSKFKGSEFIDVNITTGKCIVSVHVHVHVQCRIYPCFSAFTFMQGHV